MRKILKVFGYICLGLFILLVEIALTYEYANCICNRYETRPVRIEHIGIWGVETFIQTTPENADSYERICVSSGAQSYWNFIRNMEYILNQTHKNMGEKDE